MLATAGYYSCIASHWTDSYETIQLDSFGMTGYYALLAWQVIMPFWYVWLLCSFGMIDYYFLLVWQGIMPFCMITHYAVLVWYVIIPFWYDRAWCPFGLTRYYLKISSLLLIYDLQSEDWINTYYMLKGFLKARRSPKVSNEMKYRNEKMIWNTQDMNLSWYVPKANVDHTISEQGTAISTLDHSTTIPIVLLVWQAIMPFWYDKLLCPFMTGYYTLLV